MGHAETVVTLLRDRGGSLCDDCLAALTGITPRQTARAVALKLASKGVTKRDEFGMCSKCRQPRHCTFMAGTNVAVDAASTARRDLAPGATIALVDASASAAVSRVLPADRPWHWEGHVQDATERWLREHGWTIEQAVDTASKQQGIDLIATMGPRRLWVTVKGFPSATASTAAPLQARHWFSHAMYDVILYRERDPSVGIAVALPDPFPTYRNNARRIGWFQRAANFRFMWVDRNGEVCEQHG